MTALDESDLVSEIKEPPPSLAPSPTFKNRIEDDVPAAHTASFIAPGPDFFEAAARRLDSQDHECLPLNLMSPRRFMSFAALAFIWTSAQIPLFLFGGIAPVIYADIGGVTYWIWYITANLLGAAAICPFVGALSDLMGRKYVAVVGSLLILAGQITCGMASGMGVFICGMAISGIGSGINELTGLAGTSELAPTSERGVYVAVLVCSILPFLPSVLWAQLISLRSWRLVALVTGSWSAIGLALTLLFYNPPPRVNSQGLSPWQILLRVDVVGGCLSISGLVFFVAGILCGGYPYAWDNIRVLGPLLMGTVLIISFVFWEAGGARYPMFPRRLGQAPRTLILTLIITFISGANFFSVLMLWPSQAYNVYGHDLIGVGLRGLPFAFGVLTGCVIALNLLPVVEGRIKWLLLGASCVMTAGCGALAAASTHNLGVVYFILLVAGLGVGGIVVPASFITTVICPDDLIATITSLTIAVRVIGGAVGYAVYYNVFVAKLVPNVSALVGQACYENGITAPATVEQVVELTLTSLTDSIQALPGVTDASYTPIIAAGQEAYALSYPWVYYCSIAFGAASILASLFLGDIGKFIDDHVAVVIV